MQVNWLDDAITDLDALRHYISQDSQQSAVNVTTRILKAIDILSTKLNMGRAGRVPNTRELIISGTSYIIPYRVKNNIIEILRVYHSAMQWPEIV